MIRFENLGNKVSVVRKDGKRENGSHIGGDGGGGGGDGDKWTATRPIDKWFETTSFQPTTKRS